MANLRREERVLLEGNELERTIREFWKELDRVPGTFIAGDIVHDTKGKIYTVFPNPTKFPGSLTIAEAEELYKQGKLQSIADDEGYILHIPK